jgi:ketosteroid isomerase-like protein
MKTTPPGDQPAETSRRVSNEAAARRYCEAWRQGDLPMMLDCYHDDLVLHYFGRSPFAGRTEGRRPPSRRWPGSSSCEIHDVLVSDEHAVILARERFERDGRQLEARRVLVYHIRDGKLAESWIYDEDQRAVDEFWS